MRHRPPREACAVLRRAVRVPYYAMPNLIAGRAIVPELLQEDARPERMAEALERLLAGPDRERQLAALSEVRTQLGGGGAADSAGSIAEALLEAPAK